jgi:hypothetical protein
MGFIQGVICGYCWFCWFLPTVRGENLYITMVHNTHLYRNSLGGSWNKPAKPAIPTKQRWPKTDRLAASPAEIKYPHTPQTLQSPQQLAITNNRRTTMHPNAPAPMSASAKGYDTGLKAQAPPPSHLLDSVIDRLGVIHKITTELHELADRLVGIRGEESTNAPAPVPNGLIEQIAESVDGIERRLLALHERLARI